MPGCSAPLSDPAAEAIAQRVAQILQERQPAAPVAHTDTILTRPEARLYVKRLSEAAFCMWCKRWRVQPAARGRYSRHVLDRALDRESRASRHRTAA